MLTDKEIVLGVSGGIAAYKTPELVRCFQKVDARVTVVMTRNGANFATPFSMEVLTGRPAVVDLFKSEKPGQMSHIDVADRADILVVAPATANTIAKLAAGIADDALTTLALACKAPVLIAPAMNVNMWEHPATRDNMKRLLDRGVHVIGPDSGRLACGWEGQGRMSDLDDIVEEAQYVLAPKDLSGKKVMVTAGPTREFIDPVRYVTNRSSGKMGYAVAKVARRRGAEVVLITGPVSQKPPQGVRMISVISARDMYEVALKEAKKSDIVVKASAVADYRPITEVAQKIKKVKGEKKLQLDLTENPDILATIGKGKKKGQMLVGFAAETSELVKNAETKLSEKNLDLIVANDVTREGAGFSVDTNIVMIIDRYGGRAKWPQMPKVQVADKLFDRILAVEKKGRKKSEK